jgi:hypothetical protein
MLYLILNQIQDCSEASIDLRKVRLKLMKISELPGEDIEVAVSFIKSCQAALIGASQPEKSHVPDDLSQTVLQIMQTTTVEAFNKVFRTRCEAVVWIADETHLPPEWPSVSRITNLATGTYLRMKADKTWTAPDATPTAGGAAFTAEGYVRPDPICFNCDGAHLLPNCEKPRDEDKIELPKPSGRWPTPGEEVAADAEVAEAVAEEGAAEVIAEVEEADPGVAAVVMAMIVVMILHLASESPR